MSWSLNLDDSMVKPGEFSDTFKLAHLQKTVDVTYCTSGWLRRVKEHPTIKSAYTLLAESKKYVFSLGSIFIATPVLVLSTPLVLA